MPQACRFAVNRTQNIGPEKRGSNEFTGFLILALFYAVYIGKMLLQRRKGIQTDQMAKGKKKTNVFRIELALKVAAYAVVIEEILS